MSRSERLFILFLDSNPELRQTVLEGAGILWSGEKVISGSDKRGAVQKRLLESLGAGKMDLVLVIDGRGFLTGMNIKPLLNALMDGESVAVKGFALHDSTKLGFLKEIVAWGFRSEALKGVPFHRNSDGKGFEEQLWEQIAASGKRIAKVETDVTPPGRISVFSGLNRCMQSLCARSMRIAHVLGLRWSGVFDVEHNAGYPPKMSLWSSHGLLAARVPAGCRVLDVGCGQGYLASSLREKDCIVDGVDVYPSEAARKACRNFWQKDLDLGLGPEIKGPYDVVLMADVLEHLKNPSALVRESRRLLSPKGMLLCSTGNVAHWFIRFSLLFGEFNYTPRGILDRTHLRLFTRRTFRCLLEDEGFSVRHEDFTSLPLGEVMSGRLAFFDSKTFMRRMEKLQRMQHAITGMLPGVCAYQVILEAVPV